MNFSDAKFFSEKCGSKRRAILKQLLIDSPICNYKTFNRKIRRAEKKLKFFSKCKTQTIAGEEKKNISVAMVTSDF